MSSLTCTGCGSPLTLPQDPMAVDAPCAFCNVRTLLPATLVHLREEAFEEKREEREEQKERAEEAQEKAAEVKAEAVEKKTSSLVIWMIILAAIGVFAVGTVVEISKANANHAPSHGSHGSHGH